jgi:uncharacterized protein (TIGR03546 family)
MSPLKFIRNVIAALTAATDPKELAGAAALGMMIAFIPKGNLLAQLLILLTFLLNVNTTMAAFSTGIFLLVTPLTDRLADPIGYLLLVRLAGLKPFWTWAYNLPLLPWTAFNNTLVLGNFLLALALFIPVFFIAKAVVIWYQTQVHERVLKWKVVQAIKASSFARRLYSLK